MTETTRKNDIYQLLQQVLTDDQKAWRELVETYSGLMMAVANRTFAMYGFSPVEQNAEDVVACAWGNVLAHDRRIIRQCVQNGQWLPMIHSLVRNRAVDIMRRHRIAEVPLTDEDAPSFPEESHDDFADNLPVLQQALKTLNHREQMLVRLFFLQGRKYRDIAELTGIAQNSIGPTLGRAVAKLRDVLLREAKRRDSIVR